VPVSGIGIAQREGVRVRKSVTEGGDLLMLVPVASGGRAELSRTSKKLISACQGIGRQWTGTDSDTVKSVCGPFELKPEG
jgi:hypothetical protein